MTVKKIRNLINVLDDVVECIKIAKKHNKSLRGINSYANQFQKLKIEGTNFYQELTMTLVESVSVGEMIDSIFNLNTEQKKRIELVREVSYHIQTSKIKPVHSHVDDKLKDQLFPISILSESNRAYLVKIGKEINSCRSGGSYSACMVMMRRLLEVAIIEVFEGNNISNKIKDANGNYFMMEKLVDIIIAESSLTLSRNTKNNLPKFREYGNLSAHGKYFHAKLEDIEKNSIDYRALIEELLHHAKLITSN